MPRGRRVSVCIGAIAALVALLVAPAAPARTTSAAAARDGRPNILVVMTDDEALADVRHMPNVRKLLARPGHELRERRRLLPALLPCASDLHHRPVRPQPRRRRQLLPVRLVRDEGPPQHPAGLAAAGGLQDGADRQVAQRLRRAQRPRRGPARLRHLARAARRLRLRLLQLRDEPQRAPADLGRRRTSRASWSSSPSIEVDAPAGRRLRSQRSWRRPTSSSAPGDFGTQETKNYSPDVTGRRHREDRPPPGPLAQAVLHLVGPRRPASRGRRDDDPRPPRAPTRAPRRATSSAAPRFKLPRPPSFNYTDPADPDKPGRPQLPSMTDAQIHQLELDYQGRLGLAARRRRPRREAGPDPPRDRASSGTR